jgi:hypothetical protein
MVRDYVSRGKVVTRAVRKSFSYGPRYGAVSHARRSCYITPMIRIAITPAAYAAIAGTLPGNIGVERGRAENGDVFVWLDQATVAKLKAMRGPGESYSDVILRVAKDERV